MSHEFDYEIGSDNVFADLGLEDADDLLLRARIGHPVRMIIKERNLKQREIAELLDIDQAEVSKLMNGKYHLFSEGLIRPNQGTAVHKFSWLAVTSTCDRIPVARR